MAWAVNENILQGLVASSTFHGLYLTAIQGALDAGNSGGKLRLYGAPRPDPGAAITTQVLRSEHLLAHPCGQVNGRILTLGSITSGLVLVDGEQGESAPLDVAWGRLVDGNGNYVADASVGLRNEALPADDPSQPEIQIDSLTVFAGGYIHIQSAALSLPV